MDQMWGKKERSKVWLQGPGLPGYWKKEEDLYWHVRKQQEEQGWSKGNQDFCFGHVKVTMLNTHSSKDAEHCWTVGYLVRKEAREVKVERCWYFRGHAGPVIWGPGMDIEVGRLSPGHSSMSRCGRIGEETWKGDWEGVGHELGREQNVSGRGSYSSKEGVKNCVRSAEESSQTKTDHSPYYCALSWYYWFERQFYYTLNLHACERVCMRTCPFLPLIYPSRALWPLKLSYLTRQEAVFFPKNTLKFAKILDWNFIKSSFSPNARESLFYLYTCI